MGRNLSPLLHWTPLSSLAAGRCRMTLQIASSMHHTMLRLPDLTFCRQDRSLIFKANRFPVLPLGRWKGVQSVAANEAPKALHSANITRCSAAYLRLGEAQSGGLSDIPSQKWVKEVSRSQSPQPLCASHSRACIVDSDSLFGRRAVSKRPRVWDSGLRFGCACELECGLGWRCMRVGDAGMQDQVLTGGGGRGRCC